MIYLVEYRLYKGNSAVDRAELNLGKSNMAQLNDKFNVLCVHDIRPALCPWGERREATRRRKSETSGDDNKHTEE